MAQACRDAAVKALLSLQPMHTSVRYIRPSDIAALEINCGQLDFNSAESTIGKPFLQLMSVENMDKLAREHGFDRVEGLDDPERTSNFRVATDVAAALDEYLRQRHDDVNVYERSLWNRRAFDTYESPRLTNFQKGSMWRVDRILEPKNGSLPHVNCFLCDNQNLEEDALLFSEVWCILLFTVSILRQPKYEKHETVPVTVVSASRRKVRIVQGYVDGRSGIVNISKTPIISLDEGEKVCWAECMTILRWLVATPVGKTTEILEPSGSASVKDLQLETHGEYSNLHVPPRASVGNPS
ncbi:hypothetical protein F4823DRAFT_621184 [Ustulina deusta]|nr:hypothetical protein F4823DRAFT_621184 [Ustulina deusta]